VKTSGHFNLYLVRICESICSGITGTFAKYAHV